MLQLRAWERQNVRLVGQPRCFARYLQLDIKTMTLETYETLVTGATSGIGDAVVRALCERGVNVLAVGRRGDRLAKLASQTGCEVRSVTADMDSVKPLGEAEEWDIVVNNAGQLHGFKG